MFNYRKKRDFAFEPIALTQGVVVVGPNKMVFYCNILVVDSNKEHTLHNTSRNNIKCMPLLDFSDHGLLMSLIGTPTWHTFLPFF